MEIGTKKKAKWREHSESLVGAILIALLIRSFGIEAFKIPSGSMIPTLQIGDHIFVNKFVYGLRIPFTKKRFTHFRLPERGEAIVFMYPMDEGKDFIKRVVGLPGDRIDLAGDEIRINGQGVIRKELPQPAGGEGDQLFLETLGQTEHLIQVDSYPSPESRQIMVPEGHLFVMGDNRDNSSDSREWGFVPLENVKGRAMFVWLSIDFDRKTLRWDRFGKWIK